jgi:hypothetical protein
MIEGGVDVECAFGRFLASELVKWAEVLRTANITAQRTGGHRRRS